MDNLEDFLESIEHLPHVVATGLKDMKDKDLQVQHSMNTQITKLETLFSNANNISQYQLETYFNKIMESLEKNIQISEEKEQLANRLHDLLELYLEQLDVEIQKTKIKVETGNRGVTERIEERITDSEQINIANQVFGDKQDKSNTVDISKKNSVAFPSQYGTGPMSQATKKRGRRPANSEKASPSSAYTLGHMEAGGNPVIVKAASQAIVATKKRGRRPRKYQKVQSSSANTLGRIEAGGNPAIMASASQAIVATKKRGRRPANSEKALPSSAYTLGHMEAGGNPVIVKAASQAIVATKKRGRRPRKYQKVQSSSAYTLGHMEAGGNPAVAASASQAIVATEQWSQEHGTAGLKGSLKVINFETPSTGQISSALECVSPSELPIVEELAGVAHSVNLNMDETRQFNGNEEAQSSQLSVEQEEVINPNEVLYCLCRQTSFDVMIGCDNKNCFYEWFHCECVGVTNPPKGKWYCPLCLPIMDKRTSCKSRTLY